MCATRLLARMTCVAMVLFGSFLLVFPKHAASEEDGESDQAAVTSALGRYTQACETCNFELLSSVFSHDRDIALINVGGSPRWLLGWATVADVYKRLFSISEEVKMQHTNVSIKMLASGSAACLTCNQNVQWKIQGKAVTLDGVRMTCVLEKQEGHWRIVHGHWSLPSTTETNASTGREPVPDTPR